MEIGQKMRLANQIVALMQVENPTSDEMLEIVRLARWSVEATEAATLQAQEQVSIRHR